MTVERRGHWDEHLLNRINGEKVYAWPLITRYLLKWIHGDEVMP